MSRGSKSKSEGAQSSLLSQQENEKLEELLGRRCASMATAIAQLLMALPHNPSMWSVEHTGVVCFVKDNPQRSYFIRMFDLKAGRLVYEQELYNQIVYSSPLPYFHTFPADDCQVGLNFCDQHEAAAFHRVVQEKINQRNNRQDKKQRPLPNNNRGSLPPIPPEKGSLHMAAVDIQNPDIQSSRYRSVPSPAALSVPTVKSKKDKKNKKKGVKLSKEDIGAPSGFKHITHVGWDPNNLDPDLWKLLSQAGIGEAEMRDEHTSQLIYDVIEQSGGMEAVKRELNSAAAAHPPPPPMKPGPLPPTPVPNPSAPTPPPPRPRHDPSSHTQNRLHTQSQMQHKDHGSAPPPRPPPNPPRPDPSRFSSAHHSSSSRSSKPSPHNMPPPIPPPIEDPMDFPPPPEPFTEMESRGGGAGPPPPPPPLPPAPPFQFSAPPDKPHSLPSRPSFTGGNDARGSLLDQIHLGIKLKSVTENPNPPPRPTSQTGDGIVDALRRAMDGRSKVIHSSDEGEDDGGDEDEEDDEWDE